MSDAIGLSQSQVPVTHPGASASTSVHGATISGTASSSSDTVGSLAQLKEKSPEIYKVISQGLGTQMCNKIKDDEDQRKELQKEYERA